MTLFNVRSQKLVKKFSKVPFFANFHNFMFLNAKFWHFLNWQKFFIKQQIYGIKGLVIHKKFLIANLFLIKTFLIAKFDCTNKLS